MRTLGDQFDRQMPLGHEPPGAVEIGHHSFEEVGPLCEAGADLLPFGFMENHRDMAQRPFPLLQRLVGILPKVDAGIAQVLVAALETPGHLVTPEPRERVYEGPPDRTHPTVRVEQFVRHAGLRRVAVEVGKAALGLCLLLHDRSRVSLGVYTSPTGRRRSSVFGNSGWGVSGSGR
jgi:hypothetical protein